MTKESTDNQWIASFWRRIAAFLIDLLIIALIGFGFVLVFEQQIIQLGHMARFVGFAIALVYFGIMNSKLFSGQTLGKKILKLRVVSADNQPIGLVSSIVRFCLLGIPIFFGNNVLINYIPSEPIRVYVLLLIILGLFLSILYLYIFNRNTRQSLHDVAVGSYVVNSTADKQGVNSIWKLHLAVVMVLFLAAILIPTFVPNISTDFQASNDSSIAKNIIMEHPSVTHVAISQYQFQEKREGGSEPIVIKAVNANVIIKENRIADTDFAVEIGRILIANYPEAKNSHEVHIIFEYGYDLGVLSSWQYHKHSFDPNK